MNSIIHFVTVPSCININKYKILSSSTNNIHETKSIHQGNANMNGVVCVFLISMSTLLLPVSRFNF